MKLPPRNQIIKAKLALKDKAKVVDDKTLFLKEMGNVEPLQQEAIHRVSNVIEPLAQTKEDTQVYSVDSLYSEEFEPKTIGNEEDLQFKRSGVQDRLFNQLRAGQLTIDAELDLHGMTIPIAHQELAEFIHICRQERIRCVRIIHGKGWGSKHNQPVLKTKLNAWLQHEDNVLAFCSTPIEDGGTGAVYVLLRRIDK